MGKIVKKCMNIKTEKGLSLMEMLVVVGILSVTILGLFQLFVYSSSLSDLARNQSLAMNEAQGKLEEIRDHFYENITTDYGSGGTPGNTFDLTQMTGKGIIYIDASTPNLLEVEIVVSWQNQNDRIIGEDLDLDGAIDAGEDVNGNNKLDSMTTIISKIAKR